LGETVLAHLLENRQRNTLHEILNAKLKLFYIYQYHELFADFVLVYFLNHHDISSFNFIYFSANFSANFF